MIVAERRATSERLTRYPANPKYGTGTYRRRICFTASDGKMTVSLFDDFHEMVVEISHDGHRVTAIDAEMRRFPKTTCQGAIALLETFVGCEIAEGRYAIAGKFNRGPHCTHLIDLTTWGVSALQRDVEDQWIEIAMTDPDPDGRQLLDLSVNGEMALSLSILHECLELPAQYAGQSLFGGFTRWADENFSGFERDLWHMAQMAAFVSHGRAYVVDGPVPFASADEPSRKGACYSYSDPAYQTALDIVGYVRDHTRGLPPRDRTSERIRG